MSATSAACPVRCRLRSAQYTRTFGSATRVISVESPPKALVGSYPPSVDNAWGKMTHWARTRRGATTLVLSALAALGSIHGPSSAASAPGAFLVAIPVVWCLVWFVARLWEGKTYPGAPSWARQRSSSPSRQLREDANARIFRDRGGFLFERRYFFVGTGMPPVRLSPQWVAWATQRRTIEPVQVAYSDTRRWWWYGEGFCWENCGYESRDVLALLTDRERRRQRELERAHTMLAVDQLPPQMRREPIPRDLQRAVFERDGGRCVDCGSNFQIQYDHVIPHSLGGASTIENLQLLCAQCNQQKGARI